MHRTVFMVLGSYVFFHFLMAESTNNSFGGYKGFSTAALHVGQAPDPNSQAVIPPISLSTTFAQETPGQHLKYDYARTGNPTRDSFEACVAALEKGKHCAAFASGVAATSALVHTLQAGDEIVCMDDVYGGTNRYFHRVASNFGITTVMVDMLKKGALEAALTERSKLIWLESPTNPTMKILDIQALSAVAKSKGVPLVVDNTFMSPYFQRPLELGADVVVHSVTKYMNGHSDVVGGAIISDNDELMSKVRFIQMAVGAVPSPFDCYLALRGLKTLAVRMKAHAANAMAVAELLEKSDKVRRVDYPGLPSHPQHEIAKKQHYGHGGMITFYVNGGIDEATRFLQALKIITLAESLGGVESLVDHPASMTHMSVPPEQRKALGIDDSLVRLSVGIEDLDDVVDDVQRGLDAI